MSTSLNIKHFLLMAMLVTLSVILALVHFADGLNATMTKVAYAFIGTVTGLIISLFIQQIGRGRRIQNQLARQNESLQQTLHSAHNKMARQSAMLNNLPMGIALLNKEGVITELNETWLKFGHENCASGISLGAGENYLTAVANYSGANAKNLNQLAEAIKNLLNGSQQPFQLEYACATPGSQKWFKSWVVAMNENGENGALVVFKDITKRKTAEIELAEMNLQLEISINQRIEDLKNVNAEMEAYSYTVSHDLQAPLRLVNGFAKILLSDYGHRLDEEGRKHLAVIRENATKMSILIKDLLAFARLGKGAVEKQSTNMAEVVKSVIADAALKEDTAPAEIIVKDLGTAQCDPGLIKQVWSNLILNAIKYSRKADKPVVEIGIKNVNGEMAYYVQDNGVGFDMQYANKLFIPFKRLHTDSDFEGTGVGLATVYRILAGHGGRIWAEAAVNAGATFYFTLPAGNEIEVSESWINAASR
jgi:signal transduction histidine kinase